MEKTSEKKGLLPAPGEVAGIKMARVLNVVICLLVYAVIGLISLLILERYHTGNEYLNMAVETLMGALAAYVAIALYHKNNTLINN